MFLLSYSLTVFPPIYVAVEIRGMSMTTDVSTVFDDPIRESYLDTRLYM